MKEWWRGFRGLLLGISLFIFVVSAYGFGRYSERAALTNWLAAEPCWGMTIDRDGKLVRSPAYDHCADMRGVQLRGQWHDGFEHSEFKAEGPGGDHAWFEVDEATRSLLYARMGIDPDADGKLLANVEFIGSQTTKPGSYGHLGGSKQMMMPHRVISVQLVSWTPG